MKFKFNDKVRVISGFHEGQTGAINNYSEHFGQYDFMFAYTIILDNSGNREVTILEDRLVKVS